MSMNSQASNNQSDISMLQQVSLPKQHGSPPFDEGTTTPGHFKATCAASAKVYPQPKYHPLLYQSTRQPQPSPTTSTTSTTSGHMTPVTQYTPIKWYPHLSNRGYRCQMILYRTDSNSIWVEPTKNRTEGELILARTRALTRMQTCGLTPKRQVLDNEASAAYKQSILNSGLTYQLVPPDDHRQNVAKKSIQTWKDHFSAVLSNTADKFPLHLWCQLIPHMEHQLNLLRHSNANPKISAYAHLYGPHNYNAIPFVPLGMEALVHDRPTRRKTYTQHCTKGWVIGTSTEHYRCWKIWSTNTRTTHIAETVFFKHKYLTNPSMSPADALIAAAANLAQVINHNVKAQHVVATKLQDLQCLQRILHNTATQHIDIPLQPQQACVHATLPRVPIPTAHPSIPVISDDDDSNVKDASPPRVPTWTPPPHWRNTSHLL
ncbi:LOW QUALITY PROTEIN: hypothetical protein ACHAW6_012454 [Cyclotella cf. meneghiniana]